jgi:alkylation response protein AidB-like acyl-CoA dehydrogenase
MTSPVAAQDPVLAARELAPRAQAAAEQIERERRLPGDLVEELKAAGLFRLCVPKAVGGLEAHVATMVEAVEAVAAGDGSAGWCAAIGATSGALAAYLPEDAAREAYGSPDSVAGGVFAPRGKAVAVDGGFRANGRWPFASGIDHCDWLMGGCMVEEDGEPRRLATGAPDVRLMLFPAGEAEVIDTWSVAGLRGTGSHDMVVNDLLVPAERSASLISDRPLEPGALYAFPVFGLLALAIAAVTLGIAGAAIGELIELAGGKTPAGSRRKLAERPAVQAQVAQAQAAVDAARALLHREVSAAWEAATSTGKVSVEGRAGLRRAATHATTTSAAAVHAMYAAGGGTAIYDSSPLQRHFRDVHVATQHMMVGPSTWELTGRIALGLETDTSQL